MHQVTHLEIPAKDLKRAKGFYGKVFGWTFNDYGKEYTLWSPPGGGVGGGIYKAKTIPTKSSVRAYIEVDNVDGKLKEIKAARGKVVQAKAEVPQMGWYAAFSDPQGCVLYLWQPARRAGGMPS